MPEIVETGSAGWLRVHYRTAHATHTLRLYFANEWEATIIDFAPSFRVLGRDDTTYHDVQSIVDGLLERAASALPGGTVIERMEVWDSVTGEDIYLGDVSPASGTYGSGTGLASASYIHVYRTALNAKARITFFDGDDTTPQRYVLPHPPVLDDETIAWYVIRGNVPFVSHSGGQLTQLVSINVGYNAKLKRAYGRINTP